MSVRCHYGVVTVSRDHGERIHFNIPRYDRAARVAEKIPDAFWERAAEVREADYEFTAIGIGPFMEGVEFYSDGLDAALPLEVRSEIAEAAFEAAREVIVAGIEEWVHKARPIYAAVAAIGGSA